jgi:hypothetical protein
MSNKALTPAIVAALAAAAVVLPGGALATPNHPLPPQAHDQGGVVTVTGNGNGNDAADKPAISAAIDAYVGDIVAAATAKARDANEHGIAPQARRSPQRRMGSTSFGGHATRNWSCSYMDAGFGDNVSWPWWGETSADVSGSSSTHWWGGCPYNAGTVYMSDEICFDTVSFGASFSGVGFSSSGGGCGTWSASNGSTWLINHYYNGVHGSAGIGSIYRVRQSTGGTYRFGTTYVGLNANGSAWI